MIRDVDKDPVRAEEVTPKQTADLLRRQAAWIDAQERVVNAMKLHGYDISAMTNTQAYTLIAECLKKSGKKGKSLLGRR
jgi:uncharacterized protein YecT (DUF1311 family)